MWSGVHIIIIIIIIIIAFVISINNSIVVNNSLTNHYIIYLNIQYVIKYIAVCVLLQMMMNIRMILGLLCTTVDLFDRAGRKLQ